MHVPAQDVAPAVQTFQSGVLPKSQVERTGQKNLQLSVSWLPGKKVLKIVLKKIYRVCNGIRRKVSQVKYAMPYSGKNFHLGSFLGLKHYHFSHNFCRAAF